MGRAHTPILGFNCTSGPWRTGMRKDTYQRSHCTLTLRRRLALAAAGVCLIGSPALAIDYVWTGGSTTSEAWQDPQNWNPNGSPNSLSQVTFPTLGTDYLVYNDSFF